MTLSDRNSQVMRTAGNIESRLMEIGCSGVGLGELIKNLRLQSPETFNGAEGRSFTKALEVVTSERNKCAHPFMDPESGVLGIYEPNLEAFRRYTTACRNVGVVLDQFDETVTAAGRARLEKEQLKRLRRDELAKLVEAKAKKAAEEKQKSSLAQSAQAPTHQDHGMVRNLLYRHPLSRAIVGIVDHIRKK